MAGRTLAEIKAVTPRKAGESMWDYSQRLGDVLNAEQVKSMPNFSDMQQGGDEAYLPSLLRRAPGAIGNFLGDQVKGEIADWGGLKPIVQEAQSVGRFFADSLGTPNERVARAKADQAAATGAAVKPAQAFNDMNSYKDPRWNDVEAAAEAKYGLPKGALSLIRTRGERSNGNQVSSAGAKGVYQIIPSTAAGIKKNYGEDAYGNPQQQAMAAAAILAENLKRTGSIQGAVQQYHGGTDSKNYGPQNAEYMARVFGPDSPMGNAMGAMQTGYNPGMLNAATSELEAAAKAALQPTTVTQNIPMGPAAPEFKNAPRTDFTSVDAAVEALKPAELSEKEQLQIRRRGWMAGIGQAMMALGDGPGLGQVLGALGGGALAGAAQGDADLERRQDRLDAKMAQYNQARLTNESNKANVLAREIGAETDNINKSALLNFQTATQEYTSRNGPPRISGGNIVIESFDPATRNATTKVIPLASAVMAGMHAQKAQLYSQAFGIQNEQSGRLANTQNALILNAAVEAARAGAPGGEEALVQSVPFIVGQLAERPGLLEKAVGPNFKMLLKEAQAAAMAQQVRPYTKEYDEFTKKYVADQLALLATVDPKVQERVLQYGGVAVQGWAAERAAGRETRTTVNGKGQTSYSVKE